MSKATAIIEISKDKTIIELNHSKLSKLTVKSIRQLTRDKIIEDYKNT